MNSAATDICKQVNKKVWVYPAFMGVCGGIIGTFGSNLGLVCFRKLRH